MTSWFDDHCHLVDGPQGEADITAARAAGVTEMITVGTDRAASEAALAVARRHEGVWATAGVHPHEASGGVDGIDDLLAEPEIVAVGECGLDYHYDHSPRDAQRRVFAAQVGLAHDRAMPLVIHTREAWEDTFDVLESEGTPGRTVFHCFTGGPPEADRCLALGAHLSFSGILTFPSAEDVHGAAELTPLERLLVETDSPYLAPVPHRGRRNEPANVTLVGRRVAEIKGLPADEVADATRDATHRVYGIV